MDSDSGDQEKTERLISNECYSFFRARIGIVF